jgi:predicted ribosome quality control (RQC) complex YloA/Tae2 family protein
MKFKETVKEYLLNETVIDYFFMKKKGQKLKKHINYLNKFFKTTNVNKEKKDKIFYLKNTLDKLEALADDLIRIEQEVKKALFRPRVEDLLKKYKAVVEENKQVFKIIASKRFKTALFTVGVPLGITAAAVGIVLGIPAAIGVLTGNMAAEMSLFTATTSLGMIAVGSKAGVDDAKPKSDKKGEKATMQEVIDDITGFAKKEIKDFKQYFQNLQAAKSLKRKAKKAEKNIDYSRKQLNKQELDDLNKKLDKKEIKQIEAPKRKIDLLSKIKEKFKSRPKALTYS